MRNHYNHDEEERHSLADKVIAGVAVLGLAGMAAQYAGSCFPSRERMDSNAVPKHNIVYADTDGDGDMDSAARSKSGVLFEIKYDKSGNPYIEQRAAAFEVDPTKPYQEQKQAALNAGSR